MKSVDEIIWARWIVPIEPRGTVLERHGLVIADGRIEAIIAADGIVRYEAEREIHLPHHVLMPGLVNCHTHAGMNLMRGIGDDMALMPWLEQRIWPTEARLVDADFVADGTRHAIAEMIRGGTTCANDMYFFPEEVVRVARDAGFRMMAGIPIIEFPTRWAKSPAEYLSKAADVLESVRGDPLVGSTISPHAPYTVSDDTFRSVLDLAQRFDARIDCHVHETAGEVEQAVAQNGMRPFRRLDEHGLFSERFIAVHMTALTDEEIARCAASGLSVAHCPESNLKLASGFCPVASLLAAGVNVALGTDGVASNNDLDMFGEMRTAALLAKGVAGDPTVVPAATALEMATVNGARALGLDHRIGTLEAGKAADVVAVDLGGIDAQPVYDVVSHLVYATGRAQVTDVWIDGRRVLRDRDLTTLDMDQLIESVHRWHDRVAEGFQR